MICSYMPGTILDKCEEFVNTYGDEIIQDIIEMEMNPDEVCASLGMCTASKWNTKEKVNPYQESYMNYDFLEYSLILTLF